MAGALDRRSELALVLCACSGLPSWADLAIFGNEAA